MAKSGLQQMFWVKRRQHQSRVRTSQQRYNRPNGQQTQQNSRGKHLQNSKLFARQIIKNGQNSQHQHYTQYQGDGHHQRRLQVKTPCQLQAGSPNRFGDAHFPETLLRASGSQVHVVDAGNNQDHDGQNDEDTYLLRVANPIAVRVPDGG